MHIIYKKCVSLLATLCLSAGWTNGAFRSDCDLGMLRSPASHFSFAALAEPVASINPRLHASRSDSAPASIQMARVVTSQRNKHSINSLSPYQEWIAAFDVVANSVGDQLNEIIRHQIDEMLGLLVGMTPIMLDPLLFRFVGGLAGLPL